MSNCDDYYERADVTGNPEDNSLAEFVFPGEPEPEDEADTGDSVDLDTDEVEIVPEDLLYNLDPFDTRVFDATNRLRTDPRAFIPYMQATIARFDGDNNRLRYQDGEDVFEWWTHEGKAAWQLALTALQSEDPVPPLHWEDGLALAARDHCVDMGIGGYISDVGTDGSTSTDRAERYAAIAEGVQENLTFGLPAFSAELIVLSLYVDDGVPLRTHRTALMDPDLDYSGVSSCFWDTEVTGYAKFMVDILYAEDYEISDEGREQAHLASQLRRLEEEELGEGV